MTPVFTSPALMLKPTERFEQGSDCVLIVFRYLGSDIQQRGFCVFRVISEYRRGRVVLTGSRTSLWHKSERCYDENLQPWEEGAVLSFWSFPLGRNGYQEASPRCGRGLSGGLRVPLEQDWKALWFFCSCGPWEDYHWGRGQPGIREDSNPTLHLYGASQVIKCSHIQCFA